MVDGLRLGGPYGELRHAAFRRRAPPPRPFRKDKKRDGVWIALTSVVGESWSGAPLPMRKC